MSRFTDLIEGKTSPLVPPKAKPKAKASTPKPKVEPKPKPVVIEQSDESDDIEATKTESPEPTFKPRRQRKASKKLTADGGSF